MHGNFRPSGAPYKVRGLVTNEAIVKSFCNFAKCLRNLRNEPAISNHVILHVDGYNPALNCDALDLIRAAGAKNLHCEAPNLAGASP